MGYDRCDDLVQKLSSRSYPIYCERKCKHSFLSVVPWVCVLPKTTAIRRAAVRETSVSRHQGDIIEGPPETPRTSLYYRIEGFKINLNGNMVYETFFRSIERIVYGEYCNFIAIICIQLLRTKNYVVKLCKLVRALCTRIIYISTRIMN